MKRDPLGTVCTIYIRLWLVIAKVVDFIAPAYLYSSIDYFSFSSPLIKSNSHCRFSYPRIIIYSRVVMSRQSRSNPRHGISLNHLKAGLTSGATCVPFEKSKDNLLPCCVEMLPNRQRWGSESPEIYQLTYRPRVIANLIRRRTTSYRRSLLSDRHLPVNSAVERSRMRPPGSLIIKMLRLLASYCSI